jgi:hypothetical protein
MNPMALPDPSSTSENFSWMYLMAPSYNKMIEEFNSEVKEGNLLKQHYEYWFKMQKEKEEMDLELKKV